MSEAKIDELARSKTELLYKEVLGDIHIVIERAEELKNSFATRAVEFNEAVTPTIGVMVEAATKLRLDAAALVAALKKAAGEAADEAGNKAIDKIAAITVAEANRLKTVSDTLAGEIGTKAAIEVRRLVAVPVASAVDDVKAVANGMDIAKAELEEAAAMVRMALWKRVAWTFGAALFGAMLALAGAYWVGGPGGLTPKQMQNLHDEHQALADIVRQACSSKK